MSHEEIMKHVPSEHTRMVNGEACLTEMGVIYYTTYVEQHHTDPDVKKRAREARYGLSAILNNMKKDHEN